MNKKKLIFAHIPKTAGTSVRLHLKDALTEQLASYTEVGVYDMSGWPKKIQGGCAPSEFHVHVVPENWDFIYGHVTVQQILSNPAIDREDDNILLLSFVRDPVDRLLSEYNYIASTKTHPRHAECITTPADEFFAQMWQTAPNIHYRYLNCTRNLKWNFVVAMNSQVPKACKFAYENLTGAEIDSARFDQRLNVTKDFDEIGRASKLRSSDLSETQLAEIRELHHLDVALVNAVKEEGIIFKNPAWDV